MSIMNYAKNIAIGASVVGAATAASTFVGEKGTDPINAGEIGLGIGAIGGAVFAGGKNLSLALKNKHGFSSLFTKEERAASLVEDRLLNLTGDKDAHLDRKIIVGNTIGKLYLNSINEHVIQPAINTVKNLATGRFNNISASNIAATAVAGYGVYEAGEAVKSTGEGNFGSAALSLASFGASKLLYMGAKAGIEKGLALHKAGESIPEHMKKYLTEKEGLKRDLNDLKLYGGLGYVWSKKINPITEYMSNIGNAASKQEKIDNLKNMSPKEARIVAKQIETGLKYGLEIKELGTRRHYDEYSKGYNSILNKTKSGKLDLTKKNIEQREQRLNEKAFSEKGIEIAENAERYERKLKSKNGGSITLYNNITGDDFQERMGNFIGSIHSDFDRLPGGQEFYSPKTDLKEKAVFTMMHPDSKVDKYQELFGDLNKLVTGIDNDEEERTFNPVRATDEEKAERRERAKEKMANKAKAFLELGKEADRLGIDLKNREAEDLLSTYRKENLPKGFIFTHDRHFGAHYGFTKTEDYPRFQPVGTSEEIFNWGTSKDKDGKIAKQFEEHFAKEQEFRKRKIYATEDDRSLIKKLRTGWRPWRETQ